MARSFTITQDGVSRSFTVQTGVGPAGPAGSDGANGTNGTDATVTAANVASAINGTSEKTTPVDSDVVSILDSAASWAMKKLSWANIKATLKLYFDTLYMAITGLDGVMLVKVNGTRQMFVASANTDTARFAAWTLAHTALETGGTLIAPAGNYYVTANFINLKSARYVFENCRFYIDAATAAGGGGAYANWTFWANELTAFSIGGALIIDGGSVSGKVGIVIQKCMAADVSNVTIKNFTGGAATTGLGFYIAGDNATKTPAKNLTNCKVANCRIGLRTDTGAEYWTFTNLMIDSCTAFGVINNGGNNQFIGSHLTLNAVGFQLTGTLAQNAGHGSFIGGSINHNTSKGVQVDSLFALGFTFVGTHLFSNGAGGIDLGGAGVHFTGCEIDSAITCTQTQEGLHVFRGCIMPQSNTVITSLTAPQRANIKFFGCKTLTGDFANNNPEAPPVYTVATLPAAAAATYGTCAVSDATTPVVGVTVAGSGAVKALVTSNGATWTVTAIP